ncbi:MAG: hypothetical protein V7696_18280 [Halioglobus sp.]
MRKTLSFSAGVTLAIIGFNSAQAQDDLIYVAVEPCRIADTRIASEGFIKANTNRNFRVAGTSEQLAGQGGKVDCLNPKAQKPVAVAAYIIAVPTDSSSGRGALSAYPSDQDIPPVGSGTTVNFGSVPIGNTTIVTACSAEDCPVGGELGIIARNSDENVVIDVQGYFFPSAPIPGYQIVQNAFATVNSNSVIGQVFCPAGKQALGGGGTVADPSWFMDSSVPRPDGGGWEVRYRSSGSTFSAAGSTWVVCANAN